MFQYCNILLQVLAANVILLFISFPDHLWMHWVVWVLSQSSGTPLAASFHCHILIPHFLSCQLLWLTTGSCLQKLLSFLRIVGEGHCQKNTIQKPPAQAALTTLLQRWRRRMKTCEWEMLEFASWWQYMKEPSPWHLLIDKKNQVCTKGWKTRSTVNAIKNGYCLNLPVKSLTVWGYCKVSDHF